MPPFSLLSSCPLRDVGKWVHRLSNVDPEARSAWCEHCGPTIIRAKGLRKNGSIAWVCINSPGALSGSQRDKIKHRAAKKNKCERCGFEPVHQCQLDVHHRDHDHSNNAPQNLETLCANCHRLEHAYGPSQPKDEG